MNSVSYEFLQRQVRDGRDLNPDSFLNSPLYYILTGRKGAWLYKDAHSVLVACAHPHKPDRLLVFPEIGRADYALTASVLNMIDSPENGVQLARYTREDLKKLRRQLEQQNNKSIGGISIVDEAHMDWRHPVRILDTAKVAAMKGAAFAPLRNMFRRAAREKITVLPISEEKDLRLIRATLKFWEGHMIVRGKDTDDMHGFYEELFKVFREHPQHVHGLLFMVGKRPVGFSVWDEEFEKTVNFFVKIDDGSIAGLSEFQQVTTCRTLAGQGIKYANLGGSETQGLDAFKVKFQPVKTIDLLSADVDYAHPSSEEIEIHTIVPPGPVPASRS